MNWPWISRKKHETEIRQGKVDTADEWRSALYNAEDEIKLLHAALATMRTHSVVRTFTRDEVPYVEVNNARPYDRQPGRVLLVDMPSYAWSSYLNPLMMLCKGDPADHVAADFARGWDAVRDEAIQRVRDAVKKELERG